MKENLPPTWQPPKADEVNDANHFFHQSWIMVGRKKIVGQRIQIRRQITGCASNHSFTIRYLQRKERGDFTLPLRFSFESFAWCEAYLRKLLPRFQLYHNLSLPKVPWSFGKLLGLSFDAASQFHGGSYPPYSFEPFVLPHPALTYDCKRNVGRGNTKDTLVLRIRRTRGYERTREAFSAFHHLALKMSGELTRCMLTLLTVTDLRSIKHWECYYLVMLGRLRTG